MNLFEYSWILPDGESLQGRVPPKVTIHAEGQGGALSAQQRGELRRQYGSFCTSVALSVHRDGVHSRQCVLTDGTHANMRSINNVHAVDVYPPEALKEEEEEEDEGFLYFILYYCPDGWGLGFDGAGPHNVIGSRQLVFEVDTKLEEARLIFVGKEGTGTRFRDVAATVLHGQVAYFESALGAEIDTFDEMFHHDEITIPFRAVQVTELTGDAISQVEEAEGEFVWRPQMTHSIHDTVVPGERLVLSGETILEVPHKLTRKCDGHPDVRYMAEESIYPGPPEGFRQLIRGVHHRVREDNTLTQIINNTEITIRVEVDKTLVTRKAEVLTVHAAHPDHLYVVKSLHLNEDRTQRSFFFNIAPWFVDVPQVMVPAMFTPPNWPESFYDLITTPSDDGVRPALTALPMRGAAPPMLLRHPAGFDWANERTVFDMADRGDHWYAFYVLPPFLSFAMPGEDFICESNLWPIDTFVQEDLTRQDRFPTILPDLAVNGGVPHPYVYPRWAWPNPSEIGWEWMRTPTQEDDPTATMPRYRLKDPLSFKVGTTFPPKTRRDRRVRTEETAPSRWPNTDAGGSDKAETQMYTLVRSHNRSQDGKTHIVTRPLTAAASVVQQFPTRPPNQSRRHDVFGLNHPWADIKMTEFLSLNQQFICAPTHTFWDSWWGAPTVTAPLGTRYKRTTGEVLHDMLPPTENPLWPKGNDFVVQADVVGADRHFYALIGEINNRGWVRFRDVYHRPLLVRSGYGEQYKTARVVDVIALLSKVKLPAGTLPSSIESLWAKEWRVLFFAPWGEAWELPKYLIFRKKRAAQWPPRS